jgi:myo-inositol-1-phosphate synthase
MAKKPRKIGLWLVGACGGVGSTVALGLAALSRRLVGVTGLVSELPPFRDAGLVDPANIVLGGHEIREETFVGALTGLHRRSGLFTSELIHNCTSKLRAAQKEIRPGTLLGCSKVVRDMADRGGAPRDKSIADAAERLASDIAGFQKRAGVDDCSVDDCIVINVASSEPPMTAVRKLTDWGKLEKAIRKSGKDSIPSSSIYALAAIEAGCPFINFTPSTGICIPAIQQRAREKSIPYMGNDGKTGETLVKSVLAPMFAMRHLDVMSWIGQNILGNRDGAVLNDPATRQSKIQSKDRLVARIVGGKPVTKVGIDFVPSLDDWKVAWDYIHFRGFLDTKMSLQFTWSGSDSILAAPLIIDLARFAALEHSRGGAGPMRHLGFFFKDPIEVHEHGLNTQWLHLVEHVAAHRQRERA